MSISSLLTPTKNKILHCHFIPHQRHTIAESMLKDYWASKISCYSSDLKQDRKEDGSNSITTHSTKFPKHFHVHLEGPLSKMLGIRRFLDFRDFWILKYCHTLYWLSIPNLKIQNPKCSKSETF